VGNNPTNHTLKLPYLNFLLRVEEWYDFGGHRYFFNCDAMHFAIFNGKLACDVDCMDTKEFKSVYAEIEVTFDGDIDEFIQKYEVQDNE
jgi:hypothetical protein